MSLSIDLLQELPASEVGLVEAQCCWNSTQLTCVTLPYTHTASLMVTTCHSCTNTG
ncbi:hypothetical protein ACWDA3_61125 [Nonomuraea rubra]